MKDLDHVIATQEQERRNLERLKDNLLSTLAELPPGLSSQTILAKVAEYENQQNQVVESLSKLREQRDDKRGKVIDLEQVSRLFRVFQRDFDKRPPHQQRDLLREVVQKVTVHEDGLGIYYYTGPSDEVSLSSSPESENSEPPTASTLASSAGVMRSGVRVSLRLVGVAVGPHTPDIITIGYPAGRNWQGLATEKTRKLWPSPTLPATRSLACPSPLSAQAQPAADTPGSS